MKKNKLKILVALPDNKYFIWQMLVQINNLKKMGYLKDTIYVIGKNKSKEVSPIIDVLNKKTDAQFFVYDDTRKIKGDMYPSSLRPHILKKFFEEHPNMADAYFYIDPDVLFIKKIKFTDLLKNDNWYVSDTRSYLNTEYIKSKGVELFLTMCDYADVDPELIESNDNNAGGAQYILKDIDSDFWRDVESLSNRLYSLMKGTEKIYNPEHPIQSWTADMWALLWIAWKRGHNTKIIKRLDFCWATDRINKWDNNNLFHNAGVFNQDYLFKKNNYTANHPFNEDLSFVNKDYCSSNYVKEIIETSENLKEYIKLI